MADNLDYRNDIEYQLGYQAGYRGDKLLPKNPHPEWLDGYHDGQEDRDNLYGRMWNEQGTGWSQYQGSKTAEVEEHEHQWGPIEEARFTGNPHRKCQVPGCNAISLDLDDEKEAAKTAAQKKVRDLQIGDLVDLEGDPYAGENNLAAESELAVVTEPIEDEGTAILVHFDQGSFGFPPDHLVTVEKTSKTAVQKTVPCENCGEPIYTWVHSRMGPLKARAWTHLRDEEDDPRDNVYCEGLQNLEKATPPPGTSSEEYEDPYFSSKQAGKKMAEKVTCPQCGGEGAVPEIDGLALETCYFCHATGVVSKEDAEQYEMADRGPGWAYDAEMRSRDAYDPYAGDYESSKTADYLDVSRENASNSMQLRNDLPANSEAWLLDLLASFGGDKSAVRRFLAGPSAKIWYDLYGRDSVKRAWDNLSKSTKRAGKKIDQLRDILDSHQMKSVDGQKVDAQTANAIVTVYDALSDENKEKFEAMPVARMGEVAWRLVSKSSKTAESYDDYEHRQYERKRNRGGARYPCPTCKEPNKLTEFEKRRGYQCDDCADAEEGPFGIMGKSAGQPSNKCPRCGSSINPTIKGDTMVGKCSNCGWKGTKKKAQSAKEAARFRTAIDFWAPDEEVASEAIKQATDTIVEATTPYPEYVETSGIATGDVSAEWTALGAPGGEYVAKTASEEPNKSGNPEPWIPSKKDRDDLVQALEASNREEGRPEPSKGKVAEDMDEHTLELGQALDAFDSDEGWFDGTPDSVYERISKAKEIRQRVAAALSDNTFTASSLSYLADKHDEFGEAIETLEATAAEMTSFDNEEYLSNLPGGTVALDYGDLIEGGLVDLGEDDGSWLYAEAKKVQAEAQAYDWDAFANEYAEAWVEERKYDSDMLKHERVTREAATDFARDKTMVLLDMEKRAKIIDAFVNNVEKHRRVAAAEIIERGQRKRAKAWHGTKLEDQAVRVLEECAEVLWW